MAILIPLPGNTPSVFWTDSATYVVGAITEDSYMLYSVNGLGEIRWTIDPHIVRETDKEAMKAIHYFFKVTPGRDPVVDPGPRVLPKLIEDLGAGRQLIGFDAVEQEILIRGLRMVHAMTRAEVEELIEVGDRSTDESDWRADPEFLKAEEWLEAIERLLSRVKKELDPLR
jgi:hypothetical protein